MEAAIWFPLYARDYLADGAVRGLTRSQRSILVELWCFQWRDGPLQNDLGTLCRMLGDATPEDVQQVIAGFFDASEDGMTLTSTRLGQEKARAVEMQEARRKRTEAATKRRQEMAAANVTSTSRESLRESLRSPPTPVPAPPPAPTPNKRTTTTAAARLVRPAPKPSGQPRKGRKAPSGDGSTWADEIQEAALRVMLVDFPAGLWGTALKGAVAREKGDLTRIIACMESFAEKTKLEWRKPMFFAQQLPALMDAKYRKMTPEEQKRGMA